MKKLKRVAYMGLYVLSAISSVCVYAEAIGDENKLRIAIMHPVVGDSVHSASAKILRERFGIGKERSGGDISNTLVEALEDAVLASRKFDLVTREKRELNALLDELDFSGSDITANDGPKKKLLQSADYLIMPVISDFVFYRKIKPVPNVSNKYFRQDSGRMVLDIDILEVETGQKKAAFNFREKFSTSQQIVNTKQGSPNTSHFLKMSSSISAKLVDDLIDTVFPMVVIKVEGNTVWINRGQDGGIKNGDRLAVFKPGDKLIDPYTNEVLGSAETRVGELSITRVNPKFSIADISKMEEAEKLLVAPGYILRKP